MKAMQRHFMWNIRCISKSASGSGRKNARMRWVDSWSPWRMNKSQVQTFSSVCRFYKNLQTVIVMHSDKAIISLYFVLNCFFHFTLSMAKKLSKPSPRKRRM
jgi:hypothetical protein